MQARMGLLDTPGVMMKAAALLVCKVRFVLLHEADGVKVLGVEFGIP
jgi:hypothetical protein